MSLRIITKIILMKKLHNLWYLNGESMENFLREISDLRNIYIESNGEKSKQNMIFLVLITLLKS